MRSGSGVRSSLLNYLGSVNYNKEIVYATDILSEVVVHDRRLHGK